MNENNNLKLFKSLLKNFYILEHIFMEKANLQITEHDRDKKYSRHKKLHRFLYVQGKCIQSIMNNWEYISRVSTFGRMHNNFFSMFWNYLPLVYVLVVAENL